MKIVNEKEYPQTVEIEVLDGTEKAALLHFVEAVENNTGFELKPGITPGVRGEIPGGGETPPPVEPEDPNGNDVENEIEDTTKQGSPQDLHLVVEAARKHYHDKRNPPTFGAPQKATGIDEDKLETILQELEKQGKIDIRVYRKTTLYAAKGDE